MVESTIRYSKSGSSDSAAKMRPHTPLRLHRLKRSEYAIPLAKWLRQIAPRRARTHDPQHAFDEHSVIAARRAFLVRSADDQWRYPIPLFIAQHQAILHAQDCLQKAVLNHASAPLGIPRVHRA
jgi:hypothetical protein